MNDPNVFTPEYYQRLYEIEERHWWSKGMRALMDALIQKRLADRKRIKVLDAGCGTGYLFAHFKNYAKGMDIIGFDLSAHALAFCRQRGERALALASAVHPPFPTSSFDLIVCIDTLQHLSPSSADHAAVKAFARLLQPRGLLYLRTNSALGHRSLNGVDPNLYRRYRRPMLAKIVRQAGLTVERATYANCLPSMWGALREYLTPQSGQTKAIGPGLSIRMPQSKMLNNTMHALLRWEAWLVGGLNLDLPFGHSLALLASKPTEAE